MYLVLRIWEQLLKIISSLTGVFNVDGHVIDNAGICVHFPFQTDSSGEFYILSDFLHILCFPLSSYIINSCSSFWELWSAWCHCTCILPLQPCLWTCLWRQKHHLKIWMKFLLIEEQLPRVQLQVSLNPLESSLFSFRKLQRGIVSNPQRMENVESQPVETWN